MADQVTIGDPPPPDLGDYPTGPVDPGLDPEVDEPLELLSEGTVRSLIESCAMLAGMVANPVHAPGLWRFEPGELDLLTPAVTRIANRTPVLRAALIQGDWITVALVMGGYTARNVDQWRRSHDNLSGEDHQRLGWSRGGPSGQAGVGGSPAPGAGTRDAAPIRPSGPLGSVGG